jgi:hypothetical protein
MKSFQVKIIIDDDDEYYGILEFSNRWVSKKVKEAEKFVFQKIFVYDNCQISEYDYVKSISHRYNINK